MIKSVKVPEHGAEGLVFTYSEVPGSMCVITLPGIPRGDISGSEEFKPRSTYVVAETIQQFLAYVRQRKRSLTSAVFVNSIERLKGVGSGDFILTGTYWKIPQWDEIQYRIRSLTDSRTIVDPIR